ncbi:MAG: hypothetical protein NVSMB55_25830 [Mycobacteriales bacterium]
MGWTITARRRRLLDSAAHSRTKEVSVTRAERLLVELGELARALGPSVQPPGTSRMLAALTETARQAFGAAACSIALLTDDETELLYTTAAGQGADDITGMRMPSGRGVAGWVLASGQPVIIADVREDARFARDVAERTGYVPTAILAVPLQSELRLLGVLSVLDRDADRPGADHDLQLLHVFADQAAIAVEASRSFSDLGRVLLRALASAADAGTTLADALAATAGHLPEPDRALTQLAAAFAELAGCGAAERDLALRLTAEVLSYARGRSRRPGG